MSLATSSHPDLHCRLFLLGAPMVADQNFAWLNLRAAPPNLHTNDVYPKVLAEWPSASAILPTSSSPAMLEPKHAHKGHSAYRSSLHSRSHPQLCRLRRLELPFPEQALPPTAITPGTRSRPKDAICALPPNMGSVTSETDLNFGLESSRWMKSCCSQPTKAWPPQA